MSVISYDEFQSSSQGFDNYGGHWEPKFGIGADYAQCKSKDEPRCGGVCLVCSIFPPGAAGTYHISYTVNISVNMAEYGGANSLDFTWSYRPLYTGMNIPAGTAYPIRSQINDIRYDDSMISADYNWFYQGGYSWNDSPPITHSSTVVPARGSDNKIGYIAIVIYYEPVAATRTETIDHLTKDISFKITTPRQTTLPVSSSTPGTTPTTTFSNAQSSSSASSSSSSGSSTSSQSTVLSPLSPSNTSDTSSVTQSVGETSTLSPDLASVDHAFQSSQLPTLSTAAKAGATVGSIVLVALLIFILLFFRWKQKKHAAMLLDEFETAPIAYPPEKHWRPSAFSSTLPPVNPSSSVTSIPEVSTSTPYAIPSVGPALSTRPSSHIPAASTPPPEELPLYATPMQHYARYTTPPTSLALAAFANANRDLISEDLELRLSVAGYLPSDDPDNLSEEEWMAVHNVTKLELMRLRSLFAARTRHLEATELNAGESHRA